MDSMGKVKDAAGDGEEKHVSRSVRAGLQFRISHISRNFEKCRHTERVISTNGAVFLAGIMEYLVTEVLESAGNLVKNKKRRKIESGHILMAAKNDRELGFMLSGVTIDQGGGGDIDLLSLGLKQIDLHDESMETTR